MTKVVKRTGKITFPPDVNIWPHELETAKTLARYGHNIEFIRKSQKFRENSADAWIDGEKWEFKAPRANHTRTILKNLKEAKFQSENVIIDSRRIKNVPNEAILREIKTQIQKVKEIKKLRYISKKGELIDILSLL